MNTIECIKTRRSIREFKDQKVPREVVSKIIDTVIYAPSWKNTQITRYIAIDSPEVIEQIIANCVGDYNGAIIKNAPLLIAATVIKNRCGFERDGSFSTDRGDGWQMFDCGISCQTFSLVAHEYNVGTVILGMLDTAEVEKVLNIPENQEMVAFIACGYYEGAVAVPKRKTVEDILSFK